MIRWTFYYKDQKDLAKQLALTALGILLFFVALFAIIWIGVLIFG